MDYENIGGATTTGAEVKAKLVPAPKTLHNFSLDQLAQFKAEKSFPAGSSPDHRLFYAGRDDLHGILRYLLERVTNSFRLNMFGYDDDELNALIQGLADNPQVFTQLTLDKSQAGGVHERKILETWDPEKFASVAVVGTSATHQISHTKGGVIDGLVAWEGSTNWSASGEGTGTPGSAGYKAQNNTLLISTDRVLIAEFSAELDREHAAAKVGKPVN